MAENEQLSHALKMRFGLKPGEPKTYQLQAITARIRGIKSAGRVPSYEDWRAAVAAVCPSFQTCVYAGVDNSDLNTLLTLAILSAGAKK